MDPFDFWLLLGIWLVVLLVAQLLDRALDSAERRDARRRNSQARRVR